MTPKLCLFEFTPLTDRSVTKQPALYQLSYDPKTLRFFLKASVFYTLINQMSTEILFL